ncbi:hypothetical protein CEXT_278401 [Caerostris extrusa]|uniref:Uncharacterized protein n=1 Tax=Caerostris extrusa TaxID=172846 RepID=A0AAV4S1U4_CAEEX|nr:hypothetical protein CEXT_278401 [Caerostris extrusa]
MSSVDSTRRTSPLKRSATMLPPSNATSWKHDSGRGFRKGKQRYPASNCKTMEKCRTYTVSGHQSILPKFSLIAVHVPVLSVPTATKSSASSVQQKPQIPQSKSKPPNLPWVRGHRQQTDDISTSWCPQGLSANRNSKTRRFRLVQSSKAPSGEPTCSSNSAASWTVILIWFHDGNINMVFALFSCGLFLKKRFSSNQRTCQRRPDLLLADHIHHSSSIPPLPRDCPLTISKPQAFRPSDWLESQADGAQPACPDPQAKMAEQSLRIHAW